MASEARRPGTAPGIGEILQDLFKEPATPTLGREEATRRIRAKIEAAKLTCERLEISEMPVRRGALFDMAGARVPFPTSGTYDRCYVALVDPQVEAQWGHPAHWAFVPADGRGEVVLQPTELPEHPSAGPRFFLASS